MMKQNHNSFHWLLVEKINLHVHLIECLTLVQVTIVMLMT